MSFSGSPPRRSGRHGRARVAAAPPAPAAAEPTAGLPGQRARLVPRQSAPGARRLFWGWAATLVVLISAGTAAYHWRGPSRQPGHRSRVPTQRSASASRQGRSPPPRYCRPARKARSRPSRRYGRVLTRDPARPAPPAPSRRRSPLPSPRRGSDTPDRYGAGCRGDEACVGSAGACPGIHQGAASEQAGLGALRHLRQRLVDGRMLGHCGDARRALVVHQHHVGAGLVQARDAGRHQLGERGRVDVVQHAVGAHLPNHQIGPDRQDVGVQPRDLLARILAVGAAVDDRDMRVRQALRQGGLQHGGIGVRRVGRLPASRRG